MATSTCAIAALLVCLAAAHAAPLTTRVQTLSDENFEHLTQAASGATTGKWFVKFYAPWCGHCQKLAPLWDEASLELQNQVVLGKVDCTTSPKTCKRFKVEGYPTLLVLHQGEMFPYTGPRDLEHLVAFARDHESEPGQHIPPEPSYCEELFEPVLEAILDALHMSKNNKDSATIIFMMGLAAGTFVMIIMWRLLSKHERDMAALGVKDAEGRKKKKAAAQAGAASAQEDSAASTGGAAKKDD